MAFAKGDRVRKALSGSAGTVDGRPVPGYAWVHWDNGSYYPVSEDSLRLIEPVLAQQCRELITRWDAEAGEPAAAGFDEGFSAGLDKAARRLEELLGRAPE